MPWYGYSLIALLSSPGYALGSKWALNLKINKTKLLAYIFLGLFFGYLAYNLRDIDSLSEKMHNPLFYGWGFLAAILSIVGNVFHIKSFEKSPNPGYVQAVTITNAVLVLFASAIIFNSPIDWAKFLGIIVSLAGLYLLLVSRKNVGKNDWQFSAVMAMVFYGTMFLVVKQMSNLGIKPEQILLVLLFFASLGFLGMCFVQGVGFKISESPKIIFVPIILAVVFSFVNNLSNYIAIKLVSNTGYALAITNASAILILPLSSLLFGQEKGGEFNLRKWIGVFVTVVGIVMIILF